MSEYWGEVTCVGECRDRAIYEELRSDGHERFSVDLGKRYMEMACRKEGDAVPAWFGAHWVFCLCTVCRVCVGRTRLVCQ